MANTREKEEEYLTKLLEIARGSKIEDYLESLEYLPRPARGFSVKTELKLSSNGRGIGVFAAEFLPKGTRIDTDREHISMTRKQAYAFFDAVPNNRQRQWWLEHIYCLDGLMKIDMEEFDTMMVNHSDDPSIVTREDGWDYTTRDVQIGEELTEDYQTYDLVCYYDELCIKYGVISFSEYWK